MDAATGLRVDQDDGTRVLKREVYEFWSSDLLALFERAGVPRKLPPPFLPAIGNDLLARGGHPPKITLPANEMTLSPDVRQRTQEFRFGPKPRAA